MSFIARSAPLLACLALTACAAAGTVPPPSGAISQTGGPEETSPYGLYLAGHAALDRGSSRIAAGYFARAQATEPDAGFIKERLFTAALFSGDITAAAQNAPGPDEGSATFRQLGQMARAVEALSTGRDREAYATMSQVMTGHGWGAAALLKPWTAAAIGNWEEATVAPDDGDRLFMLIARLNQAMLYERAKQYGDADNSFKVLMADPSSRALIASSYGQYLERRGRRAEAVAVYDQGLAASPGDEALTAARARAASRGKAPPMQTIRQGAAQALMAPAATLVSQRETDTALVYLRFILRLDPARDDAWMMVGDIVEDAGDHDASREAYQHVTARSGQYVASQARLAQLVMASDKSAALAMARATAAQRPHDRAAQMLLAEVLRANARYDEAVQVMNGVISAEGEGADWRLFYLRGVALEQAGRWADAEVDLKHAMALKPDDPEMLNYVGYSWLTRKVHTQEAIALIQKAVNAEPENGAYIDSLGYGYYLAGDTAKAVATLEHAAELVAGDAEVNDHLGDAYWRAGRHDEARFQWNAALSLSPSPEVKARAEAKLASPQGVDAVAAPPAPAQPAPPK